MLLQLFRPTLEGILFPRLWQSRRNLNGPLVYVCEKHSHQGKFCLLLESLFGWLLTVHFGLHCRMHKPGEPQMSTKTWLLENKRLGYIRFHRNAGPEQIDATTRTGSWIHNGRLLKKTSDKTLS